MILRRSLDECHTLCTTPRFPIRRRPSKRCRYRVMIGIGGNVGDTVRRMEKLWIALRREVRLTPCQSGPILRNPPFGYLEQDDFYNTLIEIETSLQPRALLRHIWRIEKRFGRRRSFPNAPRTLDLDIIFFGKRTVRHPELMIPHPHWKGRVSVTVPLRRMKDARRTLRRRYENLDI